MMRFARRILVLLSSLLVLMPMGWCCWLVPMAQASGSAPQVVPCKSCCSPQPKQSTPPKPYETPRRSPCGCDQRLAVTTAADQSEVSVSALPMLVEIEPIQVASALESPPSFWTSLPPPLNVLHCVWLC